MLNLKDAAIFVSTLIAGKGFFDIFGVEVAARQNVLSRFEILPDTVGCLVVKIYDCSDAISTINVSAS